MSLFPNPVVLVINIPRIHKILYLVSPCFFDKEAQMDNLAGDGYWVQPGQSCGCGTRWVTKLEASKTRGETWGGKKNLCWCFFLIIKCATQSLCLLCNGGFNGTDVTKQHKGDSYFHCPGDCWVTRSSAVSAQKIARSTKKLQTGRPELGLLFWSPGVWFYSAKQSRTLGLIGPACLKACIFMQLNLE